MRMEMTDSARQLISRAQAGDREAFAAVFEQYKNLVYKTAYLLLGEAQDAEDALQEVFMQVHRSLAGFDPRRGAFTTWLYRITLNYCLNLRRRRKPATVPLDTSGLSNNFPAAQLAETEVVWQTLRQLSPKQQAVVVLRYYWGHSYADMAQILEIPLGTVKSRLDLALKTLRKRLEDHEPRACPEPEAKVY
jgi:RNA polymerase sigma-70 factor, ECF subfamily